MQRTLVFMLKNVLANCKIDDTTIKNQTIDLIYYLTPLVLGKR